MEKERQPMTGFPLLADFISSDVDHTPSMYKRFGRLSARNLLYMQSELAELEAKQDEYDREDFGATLSEKESLHNWRLFKQRSQQEGATTTATTGGKHDRDQKRMELAERISHVLKIYKEALLLESSILALRPPTKQSHAAFRNYFMNRDCSRIDFPTLTGASETLYDDREDLVALKRQAEEDRLSAFFRKHMGFFFQVKKEGSSTSRPSHHLRYISSQRISTAVAVINILLAATFLFGSILNLYYVREETTRLGLLAVYTTAFTLCVALLTNAKRPEIFSAGAAYAAVLVVFVSSDIGSTPESRNL